MQCLTSSPAASYTIELARGYEQRQNLRRRCDHDFFPDTHGFTCIPYNMIDVYHHNIEMRLVITHLVHTLVRDSTQAGYRVRGTSDERRTSPRMKDQTRSSLARCFPRTLHSTHHVTPRPSTSSTRSPHPSQRSCAFFA